MNFIKFFIGVLNGEFSIVKILTNLINRLFTIFVMSKESARCPYCESVFNNKEDLSKHIDRIHLGSGLLEGDSRKL